MTRLAPLVVALVVVGCGGCGSSSPPADGGAPDAAVGGDSGSTDDAAGGDAGKLTFGAVCSDNAQCESNVCIVFGQGTWCTLACTDPSQCPTGSQGQKCNQQGYCRP